MLPGANYIVNSEEINIHICVLVRCTDLHMPMIEKGEEESSVGSTSRSSNSETNCSNLNETSEETSSISLGVIHQHQLLQSLLQSSSNPSIQIKPSDLQEKLQKEQDVHPLKRTRLTHATRWYSETLVPPPRQSVSTTGSTKAPAADSRVRQHPHSGIFLESLYSIPLSISPSEYIQSAIERLVWEGRLVAAPANMAQDLSTIGAIAAAMKKDEKLYQRVANLFQILIKLVTFDSPNAKSKFRGCLASPSSKSSSIGEVVATVDCRLVYPHNETITQHKKGSRVSATFTMPFDLPLFTYYAGLHRILACIRRRLQGRPAAATVGGASPSATVHAFPCAICGLCFDGQFKHTETPTSMTMAAQRGGMVSVHRKDAIQHLEFLHYDRDRHDDQLRVSASQIDTYIHFLSPPTANFVALTLFGAIFEILGLKLPILRDSDCSNSAVVFELKNEEKKKEMVNIDQYMSSDTSAHGSGARRFTVAHLLQTFPSLPPPAATSSSSSSSSSSLPTAAKASVTSWTQNVAPVEVNSKTQKQHDHFRDGNNNEDKCPDDSEVIIIATIPKRRKRTEYVRNDDRSSSSSSSSDDEE